MKSLFSALRLDIKLQMRNKLFHIGISTALILGIAISQLFQPQNLNKAIPTIIIMIIGGTTLLYVAALIIFEKDEGTLQALLVSPLTPNTYIGSKVISLTLLATLETTIMITSAIYILGLKHTVPVPNIILLVLGTLCLGFSFTLIGIIMVVRYARLTDFLIPMAALVSVLQMPLLYFFDVVPSYWMVLIPSAAPTLLVQAAFQPLMTWQWIYAIGVTAVSLAVLGLWAPKAFHKHLVLKVET